MVLRILGWLIRIGELLVFLNLLSLLVASMMRRYRPIAASTLFLSTQYWAVTVTVWSCVAVHEIWGWFWTAFGLFLGIVGIIPVAFLCLLISRAWSSLFELLFQVSLVVGGSAISFIMQKRLIDARKVERAGIP
jgi:hypothetical protein